MMSATGTGTILGLADSAAAFISALLADGSYGARSTGRIAQARGLPRQVFHALPVTDGDRVSRGEPRPAHTGDIGQREEVRCAGEVDATGRAECDHRQRAGERLEVRDAAGRLGREEL